jgi:hypothetical protein
MPRPIMPVRLLARLFYAVGDDLYWHHPQDSRLAALGLALYRWGDRLMGYR